MSGVQSKPRCSTGPALAPYNTHKTSRRPNAGKPRLPSSAPGRAVPEQSFRARSGTGDSRSDDARLAATDCCTFPESPRHSSFVALLSHREHPPLSSFFPFPVHRRCRRSAARKTINCRERIIIVSTSVSVRV